MSAEIITILGLLREFLREKKQQKASGHAEFLEWLEYHRYEDLKALIVDTAALRTEIDNLLRSEHAQILLKLDQISEALISVISRFDDFRGLALAAAPEIVLSDQAVSILRQFITSKGDALLYNDFGGGNWIFQIHGGEGDEQVGVTEPRLIGDDLDQLVAFQFLRIERNSDGEPLYHPTRNAIRFLESIDKKG